MTILAIALSFFLLADADIPQINHLRQPANAEVFLRMLKCRYLEAIQHQAPIHKGSPTRRIRVRGPPKTGTLQDSSRLDLIRYVSGEYAKKR